jgi:hypothetical protein
VKTLRTAAPAVERRHSQLLPWKNAENHHDDITSTRRRYVSQRPRRHGPQDRANNAHLHRHTSTTYSTAQNTQKIHTARSHGAYSRRFCTYLSRPLRSVLYCLLICATAQAAVLLRLLPRGCPSTAVGPACQVHIDAVGPPAKQQRNLSQALQRALETFTQRNQSEGVSGVCFPRVLPTSPGLANVLNRRSRPLLKTTCQPASCRAFTGDLRLTRHSTIVCGNCPSDGLDCCLLTICVRLAQTVFSINYVTPLCRKFEEPSRGADVALRHHVINVDAAPPEGDCSRAIRLKAQSPHCRTSGAPQNI